MSRIYFFTCMGGRRLSAWDPASLNTSLWRNGYFWCQSQLALVTVASAPPHPACPTAVAHVRSNVGGHHNGLNQHHQSVEESSFNCDLCNCNPIKTFIVKRCNQFRRGWVLRSISKHPVFSILIFSSMFLLLSSHSWFIHPWLENLTWPRYCSLVPKKWGDMKQTTMHIMSFDQKDKIK